MTVKRVFALATVVAAAAFSASAQTRELNPTVKVLARPQSPVPAECATDPSIVPALEAEAEAPAVEPATAPAPPSSDLRTTLRRLQVAAEVNDYAGFKSAFAEARRAAAAYPLGGERNAANDALQVFGDIGRVWDYAMASPTGAFFDSTAQGGSLLNAMKRYPDYGRAIADQTFTSGGHTLYPSSETRHFLTRESARRIARLGVSTPVRVARGAQPEPVPHRTVAATPPPVKKPVQVAAKPAPKTTSPKKTEPKKTASKPAVPKKTEAAPSVKIASAAPPKTKSAAIKATPLPTPKPKPAAPPPVKTAETSTMPIGPPIVSTPQPKAPATTTTAAPPTQTAAATNTTDTALSTATSSTTDTSVTAAPDTAATATSVPAEKQNGNMNLILAVVLILVGIGVLVVLFRASD